MPNLTINFPSGAKEVLIVEHVELCPHCNRDVSAVIVTVCVINKFRVEIIYRCPRSQCKRTYIGSFYGENTKVFIKAAVYPDYKTIVEKEFQPLVKEISPSFVEIYNQALRAEQLNLEHISGMGYRKALEFLIKDYVLSSNPESKNVIEDHKTTLNKVIKEFIMDARIIQTATRAAWLGNDETHYVRKWNNKDISDLKILIDLVVHWVSMEKLTKQYLESMN
ncbi:hypothetical protein [Paenibacillus lautus]|uniref:hypothetical protein n=1 Tax=Paenibacillus lautus TaxID=1401 RepID=UPI003D2E3AF2